MTTPTTNRSHTLRRTGLGAGATALVLLLGATNPSQAAFLCRQLHGSCTEHAVSTDCPSPVGLCIAGPYTGQIQGAFHGQATSIISTADTPTTGVAMFTSDSTITATIGNRNGTLIIKNAVAFAAGNGGPIVDLQTIIAGTDQLAGATGTRRATDTFSPPPAANPTASAPSACPDQRPPPHPTRIGAAKPPLRRPQPKGTPI